MPFTTPPPKRPIAPPVLTVWIETQQQNDAQGRPIERLSGRLSREAQDYILKLDRYHQALDAYLVAMAAAIP